MKKILILSCIFLVSTSAFAVDDGYFETNTKPDKVRLERQHQYEVIKKDMQYIKDVKKAEYEKLSTKNKEKIELKKRDSQFNFGRPAPLSNTLILLSIPE